MLRSITYVLARGYHIHIKESSDEVSRDTTTNRITRFGPSADSHLPVPPLEKRPAPAESWLGEGRGTHVRDLGFRGLRRQLPRDLKLKGARSRKVLAAPSFLSTTRGLQQLQTAQTYDSAHQLTCDTSRHAFSFVEARNYTHSLRSFCFVRPPATTPAMPIRFRLPASLPASGRRASAAMPAPAASAAAAARLSARTLSLSSRPLSVSQHCVTTPRPCSRAFSSGTSVTVTATDRSVKIASSEATKRAEL